MHIRIAADDDEQALTDLRSWLGRDPGTRLLSVEPVSGAGPTLSVLEALDITFGHAVDVANFALAYTTWRSTRPGRTAGNGARTLTYGDTTVDISHLTTKELTELIRSLDGQAASGYADNDPDEGRRLS
jgi:hypothetical protein